MGHGSTNLPGDLLDEASSTRTGSVKNFTLGELAYGSHNYITFTIVDMNGGAYPCLLEKPIMTDPGASAMVALLLTSITSDLDVVASVAGSVNEYSLVNSVKLISPE